MKRQCELLGFNRSWFYYKPLDRSEPREKTDLKGYIMQEYMTHPFYGYRRINTAIAVDDTHGDSHLFGGWTIICADDKRPETLFSALREGKFHASTGPDIFTFDVDFENRRVYAEFSPIDKAIVMTKASAGICLKAPNHLPPEHVESGFIEKNGEKREFFSFSIPEGMNYFRCELTDANGGRAWTNSIVI